MSTLFKAEMYSPLTEAAGPWAIDPPHLAAVRAALEAFALAPRRPEPRRVIPMMSDSLAEAAGFASGTGVRVVELSGTMSKGGSFGASTLDVRRNLRRAAADSAVTAVLLKIESPGGVVAGTSDLADEVRATRRVKPVWSFIEDLGASAAYWVASATETIYANSPLALVGSIGTVMTVYDQSRAFENAGVVARTFRTGELKGAGTPGVAVTPEQARYFQSIVDGAQQEFDAAVVRGRKLSPAALLGVKSGGVWPAAEAQRLGLIDGVAKLPHVITALAGRASKGGGLPTRN